MSGFWLRCDACNKELRVGADQDMQLAVRFKPALFPFALEQIAPGEQRHRCRSCGWVNVFVPVGVLAALDGSWRDSIVTK